MSFFEKMKRKGEERRKKGEKGKGKKKRKGRRKKGDKYRVKEKVLINFLSYMKYIK